MTTKALDCVEMKHEGARFVRAALEGMNAEQQRAYWQRATDALLARQAACGSVAQAQRRLRHLLRSDENRQARRARLTRD